MASVVEVSKAKNIEPIIADNDGNLHVKLKENVHIFNEIGLNCVPEQHRDHSSRQNLPQSGPLLQQLRCPDVQQVRRVDLIPKDDRKIL